MVQYRIRSLLSPRFQSLSARSGFLIYFSLLGLFLFLSANALLIPPPAMKQPMHNINTPKLSKSVLMYPLLQTSYIRQKQTHRPIKAPTMHDNTSAKLLELSSVSAFIKLFRYSKAFIFPSKTIYLSHEYQP